jgi:hypothetical protein
MTTALFREPTPTERELHRRRLQLRRLRATLTARELALGELRDRIVSFEGRYLRQVGILLKQLDSWEQRIAEQRVKHKLSEPSETPLAYEEEPETLPTANRRQQLSLRALFRELAKRIHPDHATSPDDERRRTRLMAQANDAFTRADIRSLERMLSGYEGEALFTLTPEEELEEALSLISELLSDIAAAEADIAALQSSDTAQLQKRVLAAALEGRDLLAEMANRVRGSISLAMREYELDQTRIKNPPRGPRDEDLLSAEIKPRKIVFDPLARTWKK